MRSPDALVQLRLIEKAQAHLVAGLKNFNEIPVDGRVRRLGLQMLSDMNLSVFRNQACLTCHQAGDGFTQGITLVSQSNVTAFGSVGSPLPDGTPTNGGRTAFRRPLAYPIEVLSPPLGLDPSGELVGGLFWDMRATGHITDSTAADQAMHPLVGPREMALAGPACVVFRVSQSPYQAQFASVWGPDSFAIKWPGETAQQCALPNKNTDLLAEVLTLSAADESQVLTTFANIARSIAAIELGADTTKFDSPFDKVLCGTRTPTASQQRGMDVFFGKGNCSTCHAAEPPNPPTTCGATTTELFTNFKAYNIGVPRNPHLPYYGENERDAFGYTANPDGPAFTDLGVGAFLATLSGNADPKLAALAPLAPQYIGKFKVPTLRNVTKTSTSGDGVGNVRRDYMHNGEMKSIRLAVDFHNRRDQLGPCPTSDPNQPGFGTSCWPAPEVSANLETSLVGHLGLTDAEVDDLVNFLDLLNNPVPRGSH